MLGDRLLARSVELDPAALSAASARRFVRELLDEAGRREWLESAELVVSEVVTNAVLHAHTALELSARVEEDHVRVEVRDHNPSLPSPREYGAQATTGRGMTLVDALASSWGVQSLGSAGKVVWFCIGSSAPEPSEDDLLAQWERMHPDPPEPEQPGVRVVLPAFPTTLWLAARQHHDAALRELALLLAAHPDIPLSEDDLAAADEARFLVSDTLEAVLAAAGETATATGSPEAGWTVPVAVDLEVTVRRDQAPAFGRLQDVLDESQRLAIDGRLLLPPALPEIIALRDWVAEQVIAQVAGASASAWPGTDDELPAAGAHLAAPGDVDWEPIDVTGSHRALIAADEANRVLAVSRPLADLLGWSVEQLVGRRVVTIVPPRYREAHIAGFSRYLSSGEGRILGVPVELPALRADGTEIWCRLVINTERTSSGRAVFVAELQPR